jgi:quinol monooxygenase YgiN
VIHVIAVITAKPGRREEILRSFRANVPAVRPPEIVRCSALSD